MDGAAVLARSTPGTPPFRASRSLHARKSAMTAFTNSKAIDLTSQLAQGGVMIMMLSVFPVAVLSFVFNAM
jgi:hypothetical protein